MVKEDRSDWVAVESEFEGLSANAVVPSASAYTFFQRLETTAIKATLPPTADFGQLASAVSARWRSLSATDKSKYEKHAQDDKDRFNRESEARNAVVMAEQEAKRNIMRGTVVDGERRGAAAAASSMYSANAASRAANERAPRVLTAAEIKEKDAVKAEKKRIVDTDNAKLEELKAARNKQAKQRLDYLMSQSDIFSHFGKVKVDDNVDPKKGNGPNSPSKRTRALTPTPDADAAPVVEEEEAAVETTFLTRQPRAIGGGNPDLKMRAYQLEGLNWMIKLQENGVNGILADEMGLGKTLQSISVMVYMKEFLNIDGPHIVVVPKSTLSNWMNEIKRWAPNLRGLKFHGSKEEREAMMADELRPGQSDEERTWDVCVTTYEVCNFDKNCLSKWAWRYLIIDEAHRLKNEASQFSKTIRMYQSQYRLLLTGTPLQNNLHELWALLNFLVPDVFSSADQFDEWFNLDIDDAGEKKALIEQLHKILKPFMIRRLKVDVEKSLPPKHETILYCGMSKMQKKLYKEILLRDIDVVQGTSGGGQGKTAVLNIVMQLRKCAGHPYLFPGQEDRTLEPLGEHLIENCGKMMLLDKLLKRLKEKGHRVLIFTQMTKILDILEDYVVMRRHNYCRIDGNTDYETREDSIEAFNKKNSEKFCFLLSTRAGGLGINLQTADIVILFDSDWNPQADLQAQDRAHRIGQKKHVQIFRLVTEHTIEEKVVERAQQKLKLDAMVVQSGRLNDKDKMTNEDLLAAIRFGADKVFKSTDATITDDDIDLILDQGRKRTEEMNAKLQANEKGDMLDFKMESGFNSQNFMGVDYSDSSTRAQQLGLFDIGKRERKKVANYSEDFGQGGNPTAKKARETKFPKHLRLPSKMEEYMLFDRTRLKEIGDFELAEFRKMCAEDHFLGSPPPKDLQISTTAVIEEKKVLISEGFQHWRRTNYLAFVRASARYGRHETERIQLEVGRPLEEVERYIKNFWDPEIGKKRLSEKEFSRVESNVVRGEEKLLQVVSFEKSTKMLLSTFDDPWTQFEFIHTSARDRSFTSDEDRYLLCWAHKYGHGQWESIRLAIRRCDKFRFNYYLRAMSTDTIARRVEQLMRASEREVEQLQKRIFEAMPEDKRPSSSAEIALQSRRDMQEDELKREKEKRNLKCKQLQAEVKAVGPLISEHRAKLAIMEKADAAEAAGSDEKIEGIETLNLPSAAAEDFKKLEEKAVEAVEPTKKKSKKDAPADVTPVQEGEADLIHMIVTAEFGGVKGIVNDFVAKYPAVSKRQATLNVDRLAVREKHSGDARQIWHIREEFERNMSENTVEYIRSRAQGRGMGGGAAPVAKATSPKPRVKKEEKVVEAVVAVADDYDGSVEPKDAKKAFTHFCNATRRSVKIELSEAERKDKSIVNSRLKARWQGLGDESLKKWEEEERLDGVRYKRQKELFDKQAAGGAASGGAQAAEKMQVEMPVASPSAAVEETKKRSMSDGSASGMGAIDGFHIPKKKRE